MCWKLVLIPIYHCLFPQEAELAKEKTNAYKLDRSHIFAVNMFEDFDRFMKVPDQWAPPETEPYTPGVISFFPIYNYDIFFCEA